MSIAPPSDIVLDVAQAADPIKVQAATAKLARMAAGAGVTEDFSTTLATARTSPVPAPNKLSLLSPINGYGAVAAVNRPVSPYQKFEAVVMQNFMQDMLPKDQDLFGDAASADICRSMLAEQLASQIAKTGRLGIARTIEAAHAHQQGGGGDTLKAAMASLQNGQQMDSTLASARGLHLAATRPATPGNSAAPLAPAAIFSAPTVPDERGPAPRPALPQENDR